MLIRRADTADLDLVTSLRLDFIADVRRLDRQSLDGAFAAATETFVGEGHADGTVLSWIAEEAGAAAGIVSLVLHTVPPRPEEPRTREGYVINMFVAPAFRRRGLGRALIDRCRSDAESMGLRRLVLHFTAEGRPLYEQVGFVSDDAWLQLPL